MSKDTLNDIIKKFSPVGFIDFFRAKSRLFRPITESLLQYDDDNFTDAFYLGQIPFDNIQKLSIYTFHVTKDLTERSGKKAQYEKGKKVLKEKQDNAGIFIFYDTNGKFRFSLIYPEYTGQQRQWSSFKRFTYFVSHEFTNKTFLKQIGDADFSTIEKIKEAFSVEPVTKQFYNEIQCWYFWAMDKIKFPDDYKYSDDFARDKEIRNATNLIRLITRIIFIWFLKEKELVPSDLFSKEKLARIVRDFMKGPKASNFYNAVLQNLFFGTLNQKMNERKFTDERGYPANKKEYGIKNLYRYADKFLISKNEVLKLFKDIPFLNGGLFDCLDKEDEIGKVIYVDGFSRNPSKQAVIPDYLFFQEKEERVNLSDYGLGANKPVRGLIEILNSYNFTIDENTPVDQEIALDPELLGKVFENLLASYNPETATTARKATGSYYTPREIVDYMVEASLCEYLKNSPSPKGCQLEAGGVVGSSVKECQSFPSNRGKEGNWEEKLKTLFSYSEDVPEFSEEEKQKIITAIDNIKILDPACGSGAFPMGVLHKLVFALQKIDPENKYWYELQYQKALKESEEVFKQHPVLLGHPSKEGNKNQREERLKEINETFDESINYPDYARKLYLIENCIYGVDIQPIAIQISKLRFFISLVLDQKIDKEKENFGVRALPNLETKFVAANTLIGIQKPEHLFYTDKIKNLEDEIKSLRHKYFQAKTRREKLEHQKKDKELREFLAKELREIGFPSESSEKIAKFDLFDQNATADWFDSEWMFGVKDGFDIVIGNPPYLSAVTMTRSNAERTFFRTHYPQISGAYNIYILFLLKGVQLCNNTGTYVWIIPNAFLATDYAKKCKEYLIQNGLKISMDVSTFKVFKEQGIYPIIILGGKRSKNKFKEFLIENYDDLANRNFKENKEIQEYRLFKDYGIKIFSGTTGFQANSIIKFLRNGKTNNSIPFIVSGNVNKYFWSNKNVRYMGHNYKEANIIKNNLIAQSKWNFWYQPKIIIAGMTKEIEAVYCEAPVALGVGIYGIYDFAKFCPKFLTGLLNSSFMTYYLCNKFKDKHLAGGYLAINKSTIENLPLVDTDIQIQKTISALVDKILTITKDEDYLDNPEKQAKVKEYERQIDQMVYKLYGLTDEEIKIVEGNER